ncbi:hypothetical protein JAAARDRAFT_59778 [Jaapia argillacea MUCL 33604]|uniref:CCHC-type domain-containing protein n=1 Tax=Jaapia argillacea MUCL 33604 TaxID=933084 RepID=A0A067PWZ9_9AGAM|nr:hypothetical protein JAAARDRAFT_59778 [Jaapia argillacea MUCL 33604]
MTRYTNFGYKRKYLDAGFDQDQPQELTEATTLQPPSDHADAPPTTLQDVENYNGGEDGAPPKKKRKRINKKKKKVKDAEAVGEEGKSGDSAEPEGEEALEKAAGPSSEGEPKKMTNKEKKKEKAKKWREKEAASRKSASEARRLKRISERQATTTCLACRELGHMARDCPKNPQTSEVAKGKGRSNICYRCGSTRHSLSSCRTPASPTNPLPFASCFICSTTGHLASSCPSNKGKGIYINGGSCIRCQSVMHLVKDCPLGKETTQTSATLLGSSQPGGGADEDDFHTIRRSQIQGEREKKAEERVRKRSGVKKGVVSGVEVLLGDGAGQLAGQGGGKKVVFF